MIASKLAQSIHQIANYPPCRKLCLGFLPLVRTYQVSSVNFFQFKCPAVVAHWRYLENPMFFNPIQPG